MKAGEKITKSKLKTEKQLVVLDKDDTPAIKVFLNAEKDAMSHSLQIARVFRRDHKVVLKAIKDMECSDEFNQHNFMPVKYLDKKGEARTYFEITRDGFAYLVLGFTGKEAAKFKEGYISAFNLMADKIKATEQKELETIKKALGVASKDAKNLGAEALKLQDQFNGVVKINTELKERLDMPKPLEKHLDENMHKIAQMLTGVVVQIDSVRNKRSLLMPIQRINTYKSMMASLSMAISSIQIVHNIEALKNSPGFDGDEKNIEMLNYIVHSMNNA